MKRLDWYELELQVLQWAKDRGILAHGLAVGQLLKAVSEMGELADAEGKRDELAIRDAVGDVLVCLINYCALRGIDPLRCLAGAYDQIKDRKGKLMPDGTFVKDAA